MAGQSGKEIEPTVGADGRVIPPYKAYIERWCGGSLDERQVALRFVDEHLRHHICHTPQRGWLKWNGKFWKSAHDASVVLEAAIDWVTLHYTRADEIVDNAGEMGDFDSAILAESIRDYVWHKFGSAAKLRNIADLAKTKVTLDTSELDRWPELLNVRNGMVNLRTGKLFAHNPHRMLTQYSDVDYAPGATHPDWGKALEAFPDDECREWFQVTVGRMLSGDYPGEDDSWIIFHGNQRNGKNTILEALFTTLGTDYFCKLDKAVLDRKISGGSPTTSQADLRGSRIAWFDELPQSHFLSGETVKTLTGGYLKARHPYLRNEVFPTTWVIILTTNHKPQTDTDEASWRRLAFLTLPFTYLPPENYARLETANRLLATDRRGDSHLKDRLKAGVGGQHEAILAWAVEGAIKWYANGRVNPPLPQRVRDDTEEWRKECDVIWRFADENLDFEPGYHIWTKDLYAVYSGWLAAQGSNPMNPQKFVDAFLKHHMVSRRQVGKKFTKKGASSVLSRPSVDQVQAAPSMATIKEGYQACHGVKFRAPQSVSGISTAGPGFSGFTGSADSLQSVQKNEIKQGFSGLRAEKPLHPLGLGETPLNPVDPWDSLEEGEL